MKTIADKELRRCREIITNIKKAILITRDANKVLKGRPMITAKVDDECTIWFYTKYNSEKVKHISINMEAFLVYANPSNNSYVTVRGNIVIDEDKRRAKEYWSPSIESWLPYGCSDSNTLLLKVIPEEIEYWDGSSNKFAILFKMFSSLIDEKHQDNSHHHQYFDIGSFKS